MPTAQPTFDVVPEHRNYVHLKCSQITNVDGDDFEGLCNPFTGLFVVLTYCVHCQSQGSVENFAWVDTKESLANYRRRVRSTLSPMRILSGRLAPYVCIVAIPLALIYGATRIVPSHPIIAGVVAGIVGVFVGIIAFGAFLSLPGSDFRKYC